MLKVKLEKIMVVVCAVTVDMLFYFLKVGTYLAFLQFKLVKVFCECLSNSKKMMVGH